MDTKDRAGADAEALDKRKGRLRALADRIAQRVKVLPLPDIWLEATRAVHAMRLADRIMVRFPDEETSHEADSPVDTAPGEAFYG